MEINTQPTLTTMPETLFGSMNRRQMPVTVSPFIGYPNDPEEWCDEFEVITNLVNWDDEVRFCKVSNYLSPDIRIWFKSQLESGAFSHWFSFKATFIATYPNGDKQNYIRRLAKTLQRVDEDPCNYATKMYAIAQKGKIAFKDYVAFVIAGLQPRLSSEFKEELVDTIKDLSELMQHLREAARTVRLRLEASSARSHDYLPATYPVNAIPAVQNSEPQNSVVDLLAKQIKELQDQMKRIVEAIAVEPSRRDHLSLL